MLLETTGGRGSSMMLISSGIEGLFLKVFWLVYEKSLAAPIVARSAVTLLTVNCILLDTERGSGRRGCFIVSSPLLIRVSVEQSLIIVLQLRIFMNLGHKTLPALLRIPLLE